VSGKPATEGEAVGVFVSVRGWLQASPGHVPLVLEAVTQPGDAGFYDDQWVCPARQRNWTGYLFFGCDIRAVCLEGFLQALGRAALLPYSDDEEDGTVVGYFVASHEVDGDTAYEVRDGTVVAKPGQDSLSYLTT
jgi:hypothetical protein